VGLSQDGRFLIVATDTGEQLALPADDRLRAAIRGDRPRGGGLEIEMESALSPREIQTRIRSGESLEDVAKVAGIPLDRVERFAAPVIAEREYVASQALASSVRRRGETSGHRKLRITVTERLAGHGVDVDALVWDAFRMEDGRWGVTLDYRSGEADRRAVFVYDAQARFSVAGDDEARQLLGEQSSAYGSQLGRRPEGAGGSEQTDVEPTLDLSDELAIVRAVQELPAPPPEARSEAERLAEVADMLAPGLAEESATAYAGLSDASAVPESATSRGAGWEPAIVVNYPVEPSQIEPPDEFGEELHGTDEPGRPDAPTAVEDREDEAEALEEEQETEAGHVRESAALSESAEPSESPESGESAELSESAEPTGSASSTEAEPAPAKPSRRKRASVPSWDEIMFGSPKRP
jgi:hypothetical protein